MKAVRGYIGIVLLLMLSINVHAQTRQLRKTDSVFRLIKKYIGTKDVDSIYNLGNDDYKKSVSQGIFRNYLFQDIFSLGLLQKDSLISFVNNTTAAYKLEFAKSSIQLELSLDRDDKIAFFHYGTYHKKPTTKTSLVASGNPLLSVLDKKVDTVARAYIQQSNTVGLTIGIIKDGKISTYNYGETKRGNNRLPTTSTIYEIASISKTFTAAILAWYVNEGKLHLNDRITKYLPDSVAANPELQKITLTNLSNHTSGLPGLPSNFNAQRPYDPLNPYKYYTSQLLYTYLKNCRLKNEPGRVYAYSNLAVALLGNILERVSGKTYEQLVEEIICKPLGMNTTVQHLYPMISTRMTSVYNETGKETPVWDFNVLVAHGGLKSTIDDMLLYAKANMYKSNTKLSKAFELAHQVTFAGGENFKLCLGWHIIDIDGVNYYYHNGGTYGSSSYLAYNTEKNLAVIVLSNAVESTDIVGNDIIKKLQ
ncbi:MAG TPA: serine hydrolase domain-containing protein [Mucilaginibacter sp.]|jgi:CubicO group peptidase (beta-lactamase class C family)|nr:serine hydrolase domain-containing protein [Mucilaginibacter sp.]